MSEAIITVEGLGKRYRLASCPEGDPARRGARGSAERYTALRDVISENVRGVFKKLKTDKLKSGNGSSDLSISESQDLSVSRAETREDFWALKNVSFEVRQGEIVGIIGRNSDKASRAGSDNGSRAGGAGKSTLLKILSRITEPTEVRIKIKGRVASVLKVGTGFHPAPTGSA